MNTQHFSFNQSPPLFAMTPKLQCAHVLNGGDAFAVGAKIIFKNEDTFFMLSREEVDGGVGIVDS